MVPKTKVEVRLTEEQRHTLYRLVHTGCHPAAMRRRASILLLSDADGPDACSDEEIADELETSRMTVMRFRRQFVAEGLDVTLHRKKPTGRQYRKLDGKQEAQLIALACSPAPEGQARWTMMLLADRLVDQIDHFQFHFHFRRLIDEDGQVEVSGHEVAPNVRYSGP